MNLAKEKMGSFGWLVQDQFGQFSHKEISDSNQ
jgi:hypothetical protein